MAEKLPDWESCRVAVERHGANSLETFIYHNEPAGPQDRMFREQLADMLSEETGVIWTPGSTTPERGAVDD